MFKSSIGENVVTVENVEDASLKEAAGSKCIPVRDAICAKLSAILVVLDALPLEVLVAITAKTFDCSVFVIFV
jgi:hypothetical protein